MIHKCFSKHFHFHIDEGYIIFFIFYSAPWWLENLNLFEQDRAILEGTDWLNDNIVQAAQTLLKRKGDVHGLQSPLLGINRQFKPIRPGLAFVQILNVDNNHWVAVTNKVGELVFTDNIYIYDSLLPTKVDMSEYVLFFIYR